jgi:hypothetical protein
MRAAWLAMVVTFAMPVAGAGAQTSSPPPCSSAEFHQFDFWIGKWTVTDSAGKQLGTNEIISVSGGCGLLENWQDTGSGSGKSLNMYEASAGHWTQTWVGSGGGVLRLSGGLQDGKMVLGDDRVTARGPVKDRITWTPLPDGRVRQTWDISTDGGATWQTTFDGYYAHR